MKIIVCKIIAILAVTALLVWWGINWQPTPKVSDIYYPEAAEFSKIIFYALLAYLEGFALLIILSIGENKRNKNKEKFGIRPINL